MRLYLLIVSLFILPAKSILAQFAPAAGMPGSTAIYKDSSVFVAWANFCIVQRGFQDISNTSLGYTTSGDSSMATGPAGTNGVVCLGDGGSAILSFDDIIYNGPGFDFAVFENGFSDNFLELAFVEVSSDGINFHRFPSTSFTQDTLQISGFGSLDPTQINNLAGKYRALYGTPFDLEELNGTAGLDVNHITQIKIIDVVGCINESFATYDQYGNKINDPWNTAFPEGGFDLDAVGIIHAVSNSVRNSESDNNFICYPVPASSELNFIWKEHENNVTIYFQDITGKIIYTEKQILTSGQNKIRLNKSFTKGIYLLHIESENKVFKSKIIISNE
jgi:hypothetical protein